jgi:hypothetical protein
MKPQTMRAQFGRGLDGRHGMSECGESRGVPSGTGADVEHTTRRGREEMQDVAMNVGESQALVLLDQDVGGLAVAFCAGGSVHERHCNPLHPTFPG